MGRIKPIKKLIVNNVEISKLNNSWWDFDDNNDIITKAYFLYKNGAYPVYLREQLMKTFPDEKIEIEIVISKHKKYRERIKINPEWFYTKLELRELKFKNILNEL